MNSSKDGCILMYTKEVTDFYVRMHYTLRTKCIWRCLKGAINI